MRAFAASKFLLYLARLGPRPQARRLLSPTIHTGSWGGGPAVRSRLAGPTRVPRSASCSRDHLKISLKIS